MVSIEEALIGWLPEATGLPAYAEPPAERPAEFLTVERVGGPTSATLDMPSLAIQAWAATRARAEEIAADARLMVVGRAAEFIPGLASATATASYPFPDPDSRSARYQVSIDLVLTN